MAKRAASKPTKKTIRVFIASPGDLAVERRAFKDVIDELNDGFGDGAGVTFEALAWEETLAVMTRRSQGLMNQEIDRCDIFVLAMHRRWGQEAPDAKPYSSYTEEEFHRALDRWQRTGSPTIFVFFKDIDPGQMADPGEQLKKVLAFRLQLEAQRKLIYRQFSDEATFKDEVQNHLRAYVRGDLPRADAALDKVVLPLHAIEELQKERAEKEQAIARADRAHQVAEAAAARADAFALEFAERASKAALEGRVEEARQDFAKATDGTANLQVLYLAYQFYKRTGDLATAEKLVERRLTISGRDAETADTARALGNLGLIYQKRGDLDRAKEMHRKSLVIEEKLRHDAGMARQYGNLGLIYQMEGQLQLAKQMHRKSLAIEKKLGRQEGMAAEYINLGLTYLKEGKVRRAEVLFLASMKISDVLGNRQNSAIALCNMGEIYLLTMNYDLAESMHLKARDIFHSIGHKEGIAEQFRNLGAIAKARDAIDQSQEMWTKAFQLYAEIGMQHRVKEMQELLDGLPKPAAKSKRASGGGGKRKTRKT